MCRASPNLFHLVSFTLSITFFQRKDGRFKNNDELVGDTWKIDWE